MLPPHARSVGPAAPSRVLPALVLAAAFGFRSSGAPAAEIQEGFESPSPSWTLAAAPVPVGVVSRERSRAAPHGGGACESVVLDAPAGSSPRLEVTIGPAAVIDEWRASLWVRSNRPDTRLSARVVLPRFIVPGTGRPVEVLVPGASTRQADRWELLEVAGLPRGLARQLPALHAEHGPAGSAAGAVVTHLVLELKAVPGRHEVAIDDMTVSGVVAPPATGQEEAPRAVHDPRVQPAAATAESPRDAGVEPAGGLSRGVLEVAGLPFFPRSPF